MEDPLFVEVIAYAPTAYYHCTHCEVAFREIGVTNRFHEEQVSSSLPDDLAKDYQQLSDWIREITREYCDRIVVRVIDAASVEGFIKSVRHGLRRYPALIIDHKTKFSGVGFEEASLAIAERLESEPIA
jgi:hypothetical protein